MGGQSVEGAKIGYASFKDMQYRKVCSVFG